MSKTKKIENAVEEAVLQPPVPSMPTKLPEGDATILTGYKYVSWCSKWKSEMVFRKEIIKSSVDAVLACLCRSSNIYSIFGVSFFV